MLHAVERKKTTYYRRYLGHRDGHEIRVGEEDEITSTVFGPLEFMEAASVFQFWGEVFRLQGRSAVFPTERPVRFNFVLWPKKNRVEPDAHLTFFWADNQRFDILIEIKWRAPLSGKDQLHAQWLDYLDKDVRKNCWHVFIAPEISAGLAARESGKGNVWRIGDDDRLILVSWAQIRDALFKCRTRSDGLARWAALTSDFLERIGIRRFDGFARAHRELPAAEVVYDRFFRGLTHGFTGFGRAATQLPKSEVIFQSFFKGVT